VGGHVCLRLAAAHPDRERKLVLADHVQAVLSSIAAPTLLVWGERDLLVPLELGQALHQAIQGSRLVVVPGAGHNVMFERPEQFNRLVLDFLAE